jgi:hypothetical protein
MELFSVHGRPPGVDRKKTPQLLSLNTKYRRVGGIGLDAHQDAGADRLRDDLQVCADDQSSPRP